TTSSHYTTYTLDLPSAHFRTTHAHYQCHRSRRLNCEYRSASFTARHRWRAAFGGEPPRPPVPIACNSKKRRADHNPNQCRVNKHGYRQRKSDHLNHQEVSESECREHHNHDR